MNSFTIMNRIFCSHKFKRFLKIISIAFILIFLLYTVFVPSHNIYLRYQRTNRITANETNKSLNTRYMLKRINKVITEHHKRDMKYVLLWTSPEDSPFIYFGTGSQIFHNKKCQWTNCYVTGDRNNLGHYAEFEVVLFNGPRLNEMLSQLDIPVRRKRRQKYVYANIESAVNYPVKSNAWNGFFNWTWTYRLDSDARWGYLAIRNATNHVIGPNLHVDWLSSYEMKPVSESLKRQLKSKWRAAAWFASNCMTRSFRENLVHKIDLELKHYGLEVDVYGKCGKLKCAIDEMDKCLQMLKTNYYFYFAFENALSEDYVTEKIVMALNHDAIPVVYGGADYSRFMPDGIYLDALKLSPKELAQEMNQIIKTPNLYYNFFKWKRHYSYHLRHESAETDDYCRFCAMMNDKRAMETATVYERFDSWWTTNVTTPDITEGE